MKYDLVYVLAAYNLTPLGHYQAPTGNFENMAIQAIERNKCKIGYHIINNSETDIHIYSHPNRMNFLCITSHRASSEVWEQFLEIICEEWIIKYGNNSSSFGINSKQFVMKELIYKALCGIKGNIQKNAEEQNEKLAQALISGEELAVIDEKPRSSPEVIVIHRKASTVRRYQCMEKCKNITIKITAALIVVVFIGIIIWLLF